MDFHIIGMVCLDQSLAAMMTGDTLLPETVRTRRQVYVREIAVCGLLAEGSSFMMIGGYIDNNETKTRADRGGGGLCRQ